MVTEQLAGAIDAAAQAAGAALPAPPNKARVPSGGRLYVAMMNAAGNNCPCTPCRLLRVESKTMSELAIAELEADGGSPDTQPG